MLYIIAKEGVKDEDRRRLLEHANIASEETNAITNLSLLGVKLSHATKTNKQKSKPKDRRKKREDEVSYDLSRYTPNLKLICQELIDGALKQDTYPFVKDPNTPGTYGTKSDSRANLASSSLASPVAAVAAPVTSLRSTKPSWHTKKASEGGNTGSALTGGTPEKALAEEKKRGGRIIIFIIGGMTYSEIRTIYELGNATRKDIVIGKCCFRRRRRLRCNRIDVNIISRIAYNEIMLAAYIRFQSLHNSKVVCGRFETATSATAFGFIHQCVVGELLGLVISAIGR